MTQPNAAIVRELLEAAWNRGDDSVADRLVAADHVEHGSDGPEVGRAHLNEDAARFRAAFPDLRMDVEDQISEADRVATRFTASGTHLGSLQGIPATQRTARVSGMWIHRLADGVIEETWIVWDNLGLLRQLGVVAA